MLKKLFDGELPRLVMFDLDGTLIDSVPDLAAAVDRMLLELGRPPAGLEAVRHWVGNGAQLTDKVRNLYKEATKAQATAA